MSLDEAYKAAEIMRPVHQESNHWFDGHDGLLERIRGLRVVFSDTQIVTKLVDEGQASAEQVWLCLKAAEILDPTILRGCECVHCSAICPDPPTADWWLHDIGPICPECQMP